MEIENELKELLLSAFKAGCAYVQHPNGDAPDFDEWLSNSLALGKPRPLAKNKQFDKSCPHSNEPILVNGHYECPDCGKYGEDC